MATQRIRLDIEGPAFHPATAQRIIGTGLRHMCGVVTGHGVTVVRGEFDVFKEPTGYYESRTLADVSSEPFKVWDSNVVYGRWLEGVSSRNQTTRFKGYHSFRKATSKIQRDVPRVVAPVLSRVVAQLNGGGR